MKLPKQIKVMGDTVKIIQTESIDPPKPGEVAEITVGLALLLEDKIHIFKDQPDESKRKTLIHEIAHIYQFKYGITQCVTHEIQEIICQMCAQMYYEMKRQKL